MTEPVTAPPPPALGPELAAALVAAIGELRNATADARADVRTDKGSYSYGYATLAQVLDLVRPVLAKHGLAIVQIPVVADARTAGVRTVLIHSSGERLESELLLPVARGDAQGVGSAVSYSRRYAIASLLAIATEEDDDGQAASAPPPRSAAKRGDSASPSDTAAPARSTRSSGPKVISEAQRKRLWAVAMEAGTEQGFDRADVEARLRALVATFGYESSREVLARDYDALVAAVAKAFTDGPAAAASEEPNPFD